MKRFSFNRLLSALLALIMFIGTVPFASSHVHAAHSCPDCGDVIDGEPYCAECYKCQGCIDLCVQCGKCTECTGSEICDACSNEEIGDTVCVDCAIEHGSHCGDCYSCLIEVQSWCEECGACEVCIDMCDACSVNLGKGLLCVDCAAEGEGHCPECGGCYFEIQGWCEECMICTDCIPTCDYCSVEEGMIICEECATSEGLHCPDCGECYGNSGGEKCEECEICAACSEICAAHELCITCAVDGLFHCPNCEACGEDETLCENCNETCSGCVDAMCVNCNFCSECVEVCPECGSCSECADLCENCGQHCSECEDICSDCGLCFVCCEDNANFAGCDCADWQCVESFDWDEHFAEYHTESEGFHYARPVSAWSFDENEHWHDCVYCDSSVHYTNVNTHSYDATNTCTVCRYNKDGEIIIIEQPVSSKSAYVASPDEELDDSNFARFSVKAVGNGTLTYTWCRRMYVNGELSYRPLSYLWDDSDGSDIWGPDIRISTTSDMCCNPITIFCIITDESGNEVWTNDVLFQARHNYQYYALYKTHEYPLGTYADSQSHRLLCVGECCDDHYSSLLPHEDENGDKKCDICDYVITGILITKQPESVKNVPARGAYEFDESNIAHFSVEATADSELTYVWCRKYYSNGKLVYSPLTECWTKYTNAENYEGPNLDILVPEDACCTTYTFCCFITDEEGNEVRTYDVTLSARHHYEFFEDYLSTREKKFSGLKSQVNGHFLHCVGTGCEKVTRLRKHEDVNNDYVCDICGYVRIIDLVELAVTAPKEGQKPKYTVGCASTAYYVNGVMNNGLYWFESDNGVDGWTLIDNTHAFVAGKYYKFAIDLRTADGYEFARHYSYNSKVLVKVNGGPGFFAVKTYNKDYDHYVTAECVFGECNDSVIENIFITDVVQPVAGQKPSYTAKEGGNGFYVRTDYTRYEDDNMPWAIDEKDRKYYIINGVGWMDVTEDYDWVYSDETFIPGHTYQVCVYLRTEDGYNFAHDKWYSPLFNAAVNGTGAEGNTSGSSGLYEQRIAASFVCEPQSVSTVMVYDLKPPQAGKTPDYYVSVAYPELYQADPLYAGTNGVIWYDSDERMLDPTDTFVEGEQYKVEIKIIPAKVNGANASTFVSPVAGYLNGELVANTSGWDNVYISRDAVYICYTFTQGAAPAEVDYKFGQSAQIRLIEPWGLKANVRVHDGVVEHVDYDSLFYYGVYFIRASELDREGLTQNTITVDDIIRDKDATHMTKGNGVTVDGNNLTAIYDKKLYTYEFSDSVFVLFYVVPYPGADRVYAPIRERNLSNLISERKDDAAFPKNERDVFKYMETLEQNIIAYRSQYTNPGVSPEQDAPTLAQRAFTGNVVSNSNYKFGHTVQIRLIEPWGLKVNSRVYTNGMTSEQHIDYTALDDFGVIILVDNENAITTASQMLARDDAYVFRAVDGNAEISDKYISAYYTKDIYTYLMNSKIYVMFYVKDAEGYHFGPVKERVLIDILEDRKDDASFKDKERAVFGDMVGLHETVLVFRKAHLN